MRVEWTTNAIGDLTAIYEYIAKDSPRYAVATVDRLIGRTSQLCDHPLSGQQVPEYRRDDLRELIEGVYRLIYHVTDDRIEILTVVHGASLLAVRLPFHRDR